MYFLTTIFLAIVEGVLLRLLSEYAWEHNTEGLGGAGLFTALVTILLVTMAIMHVVDEQ